MTSPDSTFADVSKRSVVRPQLEGNSTADVNIPIQANRNLATQRRLADDLPDEVIEPFHGQAKQIRWGAKDAVQQGMDESLGYSPVLADDLDDDLLALCNRHFNRQADGTYTRGDMILQWRSFESRDYHRGVTADLRASLEDAHRQVQGFEDVARQHGAVPDTSSVPPLEANYVTGVPQDAVEAAREVNEAMRAIQELKAEGEKAAAQSASRAEKKSTKSAGGRGKSTKASK